MPNFLSITQSARKVAGRMPRLSCAGAGPPPPRILKQGAPRSGPRTAGFTDEVCRPDRERKNAPGSGPLQERWAIEAIHGGGSCRPGWLSWQPRPNAQVLGQYESGRSPYAVVSDFRGFPMRRCRRKSRGPPLRAGPCYRRSRSTPSCAKENGFFAARNSATSAASSTTIAVIGRGGDDRTARDRCPQRADHPLSCRRTGWATISTRI